MRIMEIGKETGNFAAGLRDTALPDGTGVCLIGLALEDSDPFEIWVGEYTRELIMALKQEYEAVCEKRRRTPLHRLRRTGAGRRCAASCTCLRWKSGRIVWY